MNKANRILIIGDAMIDTYVYGSVGRVSPEAPVPVICPQKEVNCLGGAANVARNAAALGASVTAMFITGKDKIAEIMKEQLAEYGVRCGFLVQDEKQHTINKVRIVGNNQQIVRIDYHDRYSVSYKLQQEFLEIFREIVTEHDIVIISDYGKGTCIRALCQQIIKICNEKGKPVIIDPKGKDWEKYKGATIITPNMIEINNYSGIAVDNNTLEIEKHYGNFYQKIGIKYLLLTRSECGMSLFGDQLIEHIPAEVKKVFDVSGAGDTVVAALAATLNSDLNNIEEAVFVSNIAAGIVVSKPGTAVVSREEIQTKMSGEGCYAAEPKKIFTAEEYKQLEKQVKLWKTAGEKIVTANGCFDIVHRGHIALLEEAKKLGDRLIVVINSDDSVKRLKGKERPVNSELDRACVIAALRPVDAVVIFDPMKNPYFLSLKEKECLSENAMKAALEAPMAILNLIKPDVHVKGGDYKADDIPEAIFSKELIFVSFLKGYSTTNTIHKMSG